MTSDVYTLSGNGYIRTRIAMIVLFSLPIIAMEHCFIVVARSYVLIWREFLYVHLRLDVGLLFLFFTSSIVFCF